MKACAIALAVSLLLCASPAHADDLDDFLSARDLYLAGEYPAAVTRFRLLVGRNPPVLRANLVASARKYYAASLYSAGQRDAARTELRLLLQEDPDAQLNPEQFSPVLIELFLQLQNELPLADWRRQRREAEQAQQAERTARREALLEQLTRQTMVFQNPRWSIPLPFGIAQFYNGEALAGQAFLWSEIALLLAGTTSTIVGAVSYPCDLPLPSGAIRGNCMFHRNDSGALEALMGMQIGGFAGAGAVAIGGIIHAALTYRAERTELRRRPLTPDLQNFSLTALPATSAGTGPFILGTLRF